MTYSFTIPSIPIAQPRARAVAFRGHARMHDAPKTHAIHAYKATVRQVVAEHIKAPLTGPLQISLEFVMPRPQSHYRTGKNIGRMKDTAPRWHISKPDLDNLVKGAKDALKGVAWNDDSQVAVYGETRKRYINCQGEPPHTVLVIQELGQ